MSLFAVGINEGSIKICEAVRLQLVQWFVSQPTFIQSLFPAFPEDISIPKEGISTPILCQ